MLDDETLEAAVESARRYGVATTATIRRAAGDVRAGRRRLARVLTALESRPLESRLEVKLRRLLRTNALPPSIAQYRLVGYRLDRAWPNARVAVEADGFEHHGRRLIRKRDRRRLAAIEAQHWRIVHVTWEDATQYAEQTLGRIAIALGSLAA